MNNLIPKVIHYCWFGGNPLPEIAKKCLESWKTYCPDYKIVEWNEKNFDINAWDYVREAYEEKKWAFVSDVVRLYVLVNYGGIYMDTDVEVISSLDPLLKYEAVSGFESQTAVPTGLMGSIPHQELFEELLSEYKNVHFKKADNSIDMTTNVTRITNTCLKYGLKPNNTLQTIKGLTLLPKDYLCPKDFESKIITITKNTLTIHHFDGSWRSIEDLMFDKIVARHEFVFIVKPMRYLCKYYCILKVYGIKEANRRFIIWIRSSKK